MGSAWGGGVEDGKKEVEDENNIGVLKCEGM